MNADATQPQTPPRPPAQTPPQSRIAAAQRDHDSPFAAVRARFHLPGGVIYLDGNSLGALPVDVPARLRTAVASEWGEGLVRSWNDPWIDLWRSAARKIARLIGVGSNDVAVADSVTVNLFKLLGCALALRPGRCTVLVDGGDFPTDVYVAEGLATMLGDEATLRRIEPGATQGLYSGLDSALSDDVAVVLLSHASYLDGTLADMATITRKIHAAGALVIWDLSHTVGSVDIDLAGADADFAVGCGYKYLNGGPGAPAFLYVAPRWQDQATNPIQGWLGHDDIFAFERGYRPAPGVERFQCGTWPVLSLTALDSALDAFDGVEMADVRARSIALTTLFLDRVAPLIDRHGVTVATPPDAAHRGSQVSLRHPDGYAVIQALIARGVIGDFRNPDIMRFGMAPLYTRLVDVWDAAEALVDVLDSGAYRDSQFAERAKVT